MTLMGALAGLMLLAAPPQSDDDALKAMGISIAKPMPAAEAAPVKARIAARLAQPGFEAFEDASDEYQGKLRHKPSRLVCSFGEAGQEIQPTSDGGVVCHNGDSWITRVRPAPVGTTLDSLYQAAIAEARGEPGFGAAGGLHVEGHPDPGSGLPDHRTLRWVSKIDGHKRQTTMRVGIVGGWILSERQIGAVNKGGDLDMSQLIAESMFGSAMGVKAK